MYRMCPQSGGDIDSQDVRLTRRPSEGSVPAIAAARAAVKDSTSSREPVKSQSPTMI